MKDVPTAAAYHIPMKECRGAIIASSHSFVVLVEDADPIRLANRIELAPRDSPRRKFLGGGEYSTELEYMRVELSTHWSNLAQFAKFCWMSGLVRHLIF